MVTPSPERFPASAAGAPSPPGDGSYAWPALLALTQANRDAASALLLAMKSVGHASQHAMQPDELYCWYADAQVAADTASQAVTAFQQLTANASMGPAATGVLPALGAGASAHVDIGVSDSPPCTPRCRSSVVDDDGTVTSFTPIKHPPPPLLQRVPACSDSFARPRGRAAFDCLPATRAE